ncbi:hypothetical protein D9M68_813320 [compost metagenome]
MRQALSLPQEQMKKMGVEECLLRLLAAVYSPTPLKHSVIEFLDEFMEYASEGKFVLDSSVRQKLMDTFGLLAKIFPNGEAFRFWRGGEAKGAFSTNLFDIVSFGVFSNVEKLLTDPERTKARIANLLQGDEIKELTGAGSNTKRKFMSRLELGAKWFSEAKG